MRHTPLEAADAHESFGIRIQRCSSLAFCYVSSNPRVSVNRNSGSRMRNVSLVLLLAKSFFLMAQRTVKVPSSRVVARQAEHSNPTASAPSDIG